VNPPVPPRVVQAPVAEAFQAALAGNEPVFVPQPVYTDDRGWSLMNQLQGVMTAQGQVNFSVQYPGVIKAWHRHHKQTDFWLCLTGHIKVGVHRESDKKSWLIVTGEKKPGVVIIPPPLWHGAATVGDTQAGLLYYVTHAYDAKAPDEDRRAHDSIEGFPWGVRHG
jgi:dTDP-4-dehydrorhamnose 3,5-epimerase